MSFAASIYPDDLPLMSKAIKQDSERVVNNPDRQYLL